MDKAHKLCRLCGLIVRVYFYVSISVYPCIYSYLTQAWVKELVCTTA